MRVLVVYAHPLPDSFDADVHRTALTALQAAGHEVDDLDLYAENFQPVLTAEERRNYHDETRNRVPVAPYVERVQQADAIVFVFPTWCSGVPAILKGWFDRVLIPGVAFTMKNGEPQPALTNIRRVVGVSTYGQTWWEVRLLVSDLPRRYITRFFRTMTGLVPATYLALYDMNHATPKRRRRFLDRVGRVLRRI